MRGPSKPSAPHMPRASGCPAEPAVQGSDVHLIHCPALLWAPTVPREGHRPQPPASLEPPQACVGNLVLACPLLEDTDLPLSPGKPQSLAHKTKFIIKPHVLLPFRFGDLSPAEHPGRPPERPVFAAVTAAAEAGGPRPATLTPEGPPALKLPSGTCPAC